MAITNVLRKGFDRVGRRNASNGNGQVNMYYIPSGDGTAAFIGDLMNATKQAHAASTADLAMGLPLATQSAAGISTNIILGVLASVNQHLGVSLTNQVLTRRHRIASLGMYVMIYDDPSEEFAIAGDNSDSNVLAMDYVGANSDIVVGTGNATTGRSANVLAVSTAEETATLPLKIVGMYNAPDNSFQVGDVNTRYRVVVNDHARNFGTLAMADE